MQEMNIKCTVEDVAITISRGLKRTIGTLAIVLLFVPFLCRFSDNAEERLGLE